MEGNMEKALEEVKSKAASIGVNYVGIRVVVKCPRCLHQWTFPAYDYQSAWRYECQHCRRLQFVKDGGE